MLKINFKRIIKRDQKGRFDENGENCSYVIDQEEINNIKNQYSELKYKHSKALEEYRKAERLATVMILIAISQAILIFHFLING